MPTVASKPAVAKAGIKIKPKIAPVPNSTAGQKRGREEGARGSVQPLSRHQLPSSQDKVTEALNCSKDEGVGGLAGLLGGYGSDDDDDS